MKNNKIKQILTQYEASFVFIWTLSERMDKGERWIIKTSERSSYFKESYLLVVTSIVDKCLSGLFIEIRLRSATGICGAMRDLVAFAQFKKRENHPRRNVNFTVCNFIKINTPPWVLRKINWTISLFESRSLLLFCDTLSVF